MKNLTPDQATQKWLAAMQSGTASANYKQGIQNTTKNPMALAAAAIPLYQQRINDAVTSGRMANALNSADVNQWKANAINVGATRLGTGAQKSQSKMQAAMQKWLPIMAQASQAAKAIPKDGSIANAQQRQAAALAVIMQAAGRH